MLLQHATDKDRNRFTRTTVAGVRSVRVTPSPSTRPLPWRCPRRWYWPADSEAPVATAHAASALSRWRDPLTLSTSAATSKTFSPPETGSTSPNLAVGTARVPDTVVHVASLPVQLDARCDTSYVELGTMTRPVTCSASPPVIAAQSRYSG